MHRISSEPRSLLGVSETLRSGAQARGRRGKGRAGHCAGSIAHRIRHNTERRRNSKSIGTIRADIIFWGAWLPYQFRQFDRSPRP
eukprot:1877402-Pyramimonas_sp.AAC.2